MAKKSFYDYLPEDVRKKTGMNTYKDAFLSAMSPNYYKKNFASKVGLVEVSPKVFEKPKTKNTVEKKEPNEMLKAKRKGRSYTIATSAAGLTKKIKTRGKTLLG